MNLVYIGKFVLTTISCNIVIHSIHENQYFLLSFLKVVVTKGIFILINNTALAEETTTKGERELVRRPTVVAPLSGTFNGGRTRRPRRRDPPVRCYPLPVTVTTIHTTLTILPQTSNSCRTDTTRNLLDTEIYQVGPQSFFFNPS